MAVSREIVIEIAECLRLGIVLAQDNGDHPESWVQRFPRNCCNNAANLLVVALRGVGAKKIFREIGTVENGDRHVWVNVDGFRVDITADQFDGPTIVVAIDSEWHAAITDAKPYSDLRDGLPDGLSSEEIDRLTEIHEKTLKSLMAK